MHPDHTLIIGARFNGPPNSGNGGYCAGAFAEASGARAGAGAGGWEVTLRRPQPLDTPMSIADGQVRDPAGAVVAELALAGELATAVPPVGYADAVEAATRYAGRTEHPYPTCFVCGPQREDGLGIFPGPAASGGTAAPWVVPDDVSVRTVWAALDCPGGWAVIAPGRPYLLGRIAASVGRLPDPGDRCVVVGALARIDGRKALVNSALYGPDGRELARARATWISV